MTNIEKEIMKRNINWKNIFLIVIVIGIISFGAYKLGYKYGGNDYDTELKKFNSYHTTNDTLYNMGTDILKMAIYAKESRNNDKLYNELSSYFGGLAISGELKEYVTDNNTK